MFGFNRKEKQDVCILAQTNKVDDDRLEVGNLEVQEQSTKESWLLDGSQQCIDERTGRYVQFICSLNCNPLQIYRGSGRSVDIDLSLMASMTEDQEMQFLDERSSKTSAMLWIGICMALLTLTVCVIALVTWLS